METREVVSDQTTKLGPSLHLVGMGFVVALVLSWGIGIGILGVDLPIYVIASGWSKTDWGLLASVSAFALISYGTISGPAGLIGALLLCTLGFSPGVPASVAWVVDSAPLHRQGQMIGLYGSFEDLAPMIGPLLAGIAWDAWGQGPAMISSGLLAALGHGAGVSLREARQVSRPAGEP